jgi:HTH-type transcriptional regulator/antitoxin HipB
MTKKGIKTYTLAEMKDKHIGKRGTKAREQYEYELSMELVSRMIKQVRQQRNLTQEQLGEMVGVQKAQISKLESNANSATIDTIVRIFTAMKASVRFSVQVDTHSIHLS